jgi:hypothetical protein
LNPADFVSPSAALTTPASPVEQKLATVLRAASEARRADPANWKAALNPGAVLSSNDRILVEITLDADESGAVVGELDRVGASIRHQNAAGTIEVWVPVDELETLAARDDVWQIRPALLVRGDIGATDSEGIVAANADLWHAAGFDGTGVTIANIDTGYSGFAARQATNDWPQGAQLVQVDLDGEGFGTNSVTDVHGTGTLEINYDVAPGADFVAYETTTKGDWVAALADAVSRGVDVVSTSLSIPLDGVGDGSACPPTTPSGCGSVGEAAAAARAAGLLLVNSAGNARQQHWGGLYQPYAGGATFHDFGGTNINSSGAFCYAVGTVIQLELFWDDWTNVNHDYALELYQVNGSGSFALAATSNYTQNGGFGQTPQEFLQYQITSSSSNCPAGSAYIATAVRRVNAPTNRNLQLFANYNLNIPVAARSLLFPGDSPSVVTVAAVDVSTLSQELFSSEGPVLGVGGSLAANPIEKPDVTSTDNVSTEAYAPLGFTGTSASAPHVAGLAALLLDKHPGYTADQLANQVRLRSMDDDLGPVGFDTQYGNGLFALTDLPIVSVTADGNPVNGPLVVADGTTIQFSASATDGDGLGFPVFAWLGNYIPVSYIWSLDGASVPGSLWSFHSSPPVTFDLPSGVATRVYDVTVGVWDTTGENTVFPITVTTTEPPDVSVTADGVPITGPIAITSGTTVQFFATSSDEDGLGYPIFAWLGNNSLVAHLWYLDGGTVPGALWPFHHAPPVTFTLDPGETSRTFNVNLNVYDTLGIATQVPIQVDVTQ